MTFAVCFTNFGPYHLARLRALADRLGAAGDRLIAYEVAGSEQRYPWRRDRSRRAVRVDHPVSRPRARDDPPPTAARAMIEALERDRPDARRHRRLRRPEVDGRGALGAPCAVGRRS